MAIDYTAGFDAEFEYPYAQCPEPGVRDAINMWVADDSGVLEIPRFAVEAAAPGLSGASESYSGRQLDWNEHDLQLNLGFPDGRIYRLREPGRKIPTRAPDGRDSILGAGPLSFRCMEPFKHWNVAFKGEAVETSTAALIAGKQDGPRVPLEFELETHSAAPPWIVGSLRAEGDAKNAFEAAANYVGRERFEQLFRARGRVRVGGKEYPFNGSGLRIRRKGIRHMSGFWGHCWQSALFPSGKGFGCNTFPPRDDGVPSLNEGFLFLGDGALIPARVVKAPWLRRLAGNGEDVTVVLESKLGTTTIQGETVVSTYDLIERAHFAQEFPVLQQASARYRWEGEETYGMIERSSRRKEMQWD
jgi:hypothetical protein